MSITDASVHLLLQDRTFLVASVCRDIWQQLESGNFAIRGQVLLLVKQFVLAPNLTKIDLDNDESDKRRRH